MGLALCALRLATSARGRISWKASPLRTAIGRHFAKKITKPATAIKFNTNNTLTLLSEAIKQPGRSYLWTHGSTSLTCEAQGSLRQCRPLAPDNARGRKHGRGEGCPSCCCPQNTDTQATETTGRTHLSGTKRVHSHGSPSLTKVSLKCLLRPDHAVPSTRQQKIKVRASLPEAAQTGCLWTLDPGRRRPSGTTRGSRDAPEMRREWRAGAQLQLRARPQKSAPLLELRGRHSHPQAAVAGRRQCSSAEDRLLRAGVFVQLTGPLHHSRGRKSRRRVPASSRLRSHAQISMTLSKWGGQQERGGSRDPARRLLRSHPARKTHQCAQRHGFPDTFQVPTRASTACRTQWPVSEGGASRGWPEGGVGPPKSHQLSTRLSTRRGGGMRAGAPAACHHGPSSSSQAPKRTNIRMSCSPNAMTPRLRVHSVPQGDGGVDRSGWGAKRGCSGSGGRRGAVPRGAAAAPAPPPRSLGHLFPKSQSPPPLPPAGCGAHS